MIRSIFRFFKKEIVLTAAWIAAIISAFLVPPDAAYIDYIDLRSLGILWSLMVIMEGLKSNGFFNTIGSGLLKKTSRSWQLVSVLVFLCFFLSMLITNDVALITFVPFTIFILDQIHREALLIPVVVLETLAANLGSMLTPIGNPQNLYLYGLSGMAFGDFLSLMLPYTAVTCLLLVLSIALLKCKRDPITQPSISGSAVPGESGTSGKYPRTHIIIYGLLFLLALSVVLRWVPFWILCLVVLAVVLIMERSILLRVDYALLFTFIGFFIFTGNLGRISAVSSFLTEMIVGREVLTSVIASQVISNVPAALLLSGFTTNYPDLIIGVNLGGLGTLIASMASLISYKAMANRDQQKKGRYFLIFTLMNLIYLAVLLLFWFLIRQV